LIGRKERSPNGKGGFENSFANKGQALGAGRGVLVLFRTGAWRGETFGQLSPITGGNQTSFVRKTKRKRSRGNGVK